MITRTFDSNIKHIDSHSTNRLTSIRAWFRVWCERAASRKALAELDPRMLKDIGIDRLDALRESQRPFWQGQSRAYWRHLGGG